MHRVLISSGMDTSPALNSTFSVGVEHVFAEPLLVDLVALLTGMGVSLVDGVVSLPSCAVELVSRVVPLASFLVLLSDWILSLAGAALSSTDRWALLGAYLPEPQSQVRGNGSKTTSDILQVFGDAPGKSQYSIGLMYILRLTPLPLGRSTRRKPRRSHRLWMLEMENDVCPR